MLLNVDLSASVPKPDAVTTTSPWSPTSRKNRGSNQLKTAMSMSQSYFKGDVSASEDLETSAGPQCKRSDTLPTNIGRGSTGISTTIRSSLVSNSSHQGGAAPSSISGIISKALGKSDGFGAPGGSSSSDDDYRYGPQGAIIETHTVRGFTI